jgi:hypothetical protein
MSRVSNLKNHEIGKKEGIYPSRSVRGNLLSEEVFETVDIVKMDGLAMGIFNGGASQIVISVITSNNDVDESMPITLAPNESYQGCFFNSVAVSGSTGHLDATTFYMVV